MGLFYPATIDPSKPEIVAVYAPTKSWGPSADAELELVGSYRFDDPEGRVGMEVHLAQADGLLYQVPLTYRDAPLVGGEAAFITTTEHSVLGTRWVYDGMGDDRFLMMLAGAAMTGQGHALGMLEHEGRWCVSPNNIRISGGGWTQERVPLDRFELVSDTEAGAVLRNDGFEVTLFRRPAVAERPPMGLSGTWEGQPDPVLLARVEQL